MAVFLEILINSVQWGNARQHIKREGDDLCTRYLCLMSMNKSSTTVLTKTLHTTKTEKLGDGILDPTFVFLLVDLLYSGTKAKQRISETMHITQSL